METLSLLVRRSFTVTPIFDLWTAINGRAPACGITELLTRLVEGPDAARSTGSGQRVERHTRSTKGCYTRQSTRWN